MSNANTSPSQGDDKIPLGDLSPSALWETPIDRIDISGIDLAKSTSASVWNCWVGSGKDSLPADRLAAKLVQEEYPGIVTLARQQRYLLGRFVRYMAGEAGIRQFLDVGTGYPNHDNTHEVAQRVSPECRIVYVDNDSWVLVHARALLTSTPEGSCDYIDSDVRDPETILAEASRTLDLSEPVGLLMLGILGQISSYELAHDIVQRLVRGLAPGSLLAVADATSTSEDLRVATTRHNERAGDKYFLRSTERIKGYFDGLELVPPGVVRYPEWRPDLEDPDAPNEMDAFCGLGLKVAV
jgi:hypothetical protein